MSLREKKWQLVMGEAFQLQNRKRRIMQKTKCWIMSARRDTVSSKSDIARKMRRRRKDKRRMQKRRNAGEMAVVTNFGWTCSSGLKSMRGLERNSNSFLKKYRMRSCEVYLCG